MKLLGDYQIEVFNLNKWVILARASRAYCEGYFDARKDYSPRLAYRVVRPDGSIMDESAARDDVSIGQIAGFPTAEQYEQAGRRAFEMAKVIRERTQ